MCKLLTQARATEEYNVAFKENTWAPTFWELQMSSASILLTQARATEEYNVAFKDQTFRIVFEAYLLGVND